jgi:hypothetical protein
VILAAGMLPPLVAPLLQGALRVGLMMLLFVRGGLLAFIGGAEYLYIEKHIAFLRQLEDLKERAPTTEPAEYVRGFARIVEGLEALQPPSPKWADLNADTVRDLRRRLELIQLSTRPSPETLERMNVEWYAIEERFQRMLRARGRFWAGWPRFSSRADR